MRQTSNIIKVIIFLAIAGTIAYVLFFTSEGNHFLSSEGRNELITGIDLFVKSTGWFGPILFGLIFATAALILPITPFTAAGAFIFGKYFGIFVNVFGAVLGASIAFFLGRYFLRDFAKGFLIGNKIKELDLKASEHGFSIVFFLRIVWFPFIVLNYAAGATKIYFADFFWGTFLGILPSIAVTTLFFGTMKEIIATFNTYSDLLRIDVFIAVGIFILSFFLPPIVRRIRNKNKGQTEVNNDLIE